MKYNINYVRSIRQEERRAERQGRIQAALLGGGLAALSLALLYAVMQVLDMRTALAAERAELNRIAQEYRKYSEAQMTVTKADVELLSSLQERRIYWTRVIAAMAGHLPPDYWITSLEYKNNTFLVKGFGYISPQQEQLISLDTYLNDLRLDDAHAGVFPATHLKIVERRDEKQYQRVGFEFAAERRHRQENAK